jgi:hypothetical protein
MMGKVAEKSMTCLSLGIKLRSWPGRILDLAGKGIADLSECPIFVMDEADKLLSPEWASS